MPPRKLILAMGLASAVTLCWLAAHDASPASAASPPASTELKKLGKTFAGPHTKKKAPKKGHKKPVKKGHKKSPKKPKKTKK